MIGKWATACTVAILALTGCTSTEQQANTQKERNTVSTRLSGAVRRVDEAFSLARHALGLDGGIDARKHDADAAARNRTRRAPRAAPVITARPDAALPATDTPLLVGARLPLITVTPSIAVPLPSSIDVDEDVPIYSSADPGVEPPKVPDELLASLRTAGVPGITNTLELLVSEDGTVERVRLLSQMRQLPDMMVLGAAKMWQLEPATREGRPVAYRLVLSWAATR